MNRQLASVLQKSHLLSPEEIAAAITVSQQSQRPLWEVVLIDKHVTEEDLAGAIAEHLRLPAVKLAAASLDVEAVRLVPEELARRLFCVPLKKEGEARQGEAAAGKRRPTLVLAMADPTDLLAIQDVEFASGCAVKPVVATRTEVQDAIDHVYAPEGWLRGFMDNVSETGQLEILSADEDEEAETPSGDSAQRAPVVKLVNLLIQQGIKQGASDIHVEPSLNEVLVRARQEGLLRELLKVPKWLHEPLVSRLKILAKLDIADRRRPQDGRIRVVFEGRDVDLRVSTLPTHFGEKVVLRILGSGHHVPSTASLGLKAADLEILKNAAGQPQGLILVTGPTGSGKTTTLYSIINEKKNPAINIVTVEDPIEFQLPGINQVQVNNKAGLNFAACLRSILRQDPDVILVGEIRDLETAEIAFHAAMTGHLVLSTLHTNSTTATVARLFDLGVDPYLIGSSVNLILAQRLLRKICEKCKQPHRPIQALLERLRMEDTDVTFWQGAGCDSCGHTGYAGRIGVYEHLRMTPTVKELVARKMPEGELRKAAIAAGTVLLVEQAMELVKQGVTTIEEVLRVVHLQEEEGTRCPGCGSLINMDFATCPYCLYALKAVCEACRQELRPAWRVCPYCNARVTARPQRSPGMVAPPNTATEGDAHASELPPADGQSSPPPDLSGRRPRILVVDDDAVSRRLVRKALERLATGADVVEAANGLEALESTENFNPDLVILDVKMPGMNGFEVCGKLRSNLQTAFVPILMLTASLDEMSRTKGFLVGTDDYMGKPLSITELYARVNRLLRRTYGL